MTTINSTNTFQTRTTVIKDGRRKLQLTVQFGMQHLHGNAQPYFSMTAETRRFWRGKPYKVESCGCMHDTIVKHFPELAPLVKWHLADQSGIPMHYKANALYWRDCLLGKFPHRSYDPDPVETFASHVCYGSVEGDDEERIEERMRSDDLGEWLDKRAVALAARFVADMSAHGIKMMTTVDGERWHPVTQGGPAWPPLPEVQAHARTIRS